MSPTAGSLWLVGQYGRGAAIATDRCVSLGMQRVHDDVMFVQILIELLVGEIGERIHTNAIHLRVDSQNRDVPSPSSLGPAQATDQAIILTFRLQQRFSFPHQ